MKIYQADIGVQVINNVAWTGAQISDVYIDVFGWFVSMPHNLTAEWQLCEECLQIDLVFEFG